MKERFKEKLESNIYCANQLYKIQEKELEGVNATARLDNPGSWKSCAKARMELKDIDVNPDYGPALRYQLCKKM